MQQHCVGGIGQWPCLRLFCITFKFVLSAYQETSDMPFCLHSRETCPYKSFGAAKQVVSNLNGTAEVSKVSQHDLEKAMTAINDYYQS